MSEIKRNGNSGRSNDWQSVTVRLGRAEVPLYDQARQELGLNIRELARSAIKYFLWTYKFIKGGGIVKYFDTEGNEVQYLHPEFEGVVKNGS